MPFARLTVADPALKAHAKHGDLIPAPAAERTMQCLLFCHECTFCCVSNADSPQR